MGNSQSSGGLSREEENRAKQRFIKVTGKDKPYLTRKKFNDLLGHTTYAEGLFKYIDTDGDGSVSYKEIREEIKSFRVSNTSGSKLQVLFNYYDSDHDGMLSRLEVANAMRVACGQDLSSSQVEKVMPKFICTSINLCTMHMQELVNTMMEAFDTDKDGFLSFQEFCTLMRNAGLQFTL